MELLLTAHITEDPPKSSKLERGRKSLTAKRILQMRLI